MGSGTMDKRVVVFGLFSVTVLTGAVMACTSTVTQTVDPGDAGTVKEGGGGGKEGGGGGDGGGGDPDEACGAETTKQACGQCCVTNHPTGYKVFETALSECACTGTGADGGTGPCATACGTTFCASTPMSPNGACNTCLQQSISMGGGCQNHVSTECTAEPDCLAEQQCVGQCQSKP
jgi:hypothetical protein